MTDNEKRGSTSLALKAGLWYVISTFLVKSLSFITTPIFSRLMSKGDYGEFSNFASWQTTLLIVASFELFNTINRAYYDFKDDFDRYVSTMLMTSAAITGILYIAALACGDMIFNIISIPKAYIHVLFMILLFNSCKQMFLARERTLYRYKSVAKMSVVNLIVPTLVAVVCVVLAEESSRLDARMYGFYIPSAFIGLGCAVMILKNNRSFSVEYCKYAIKLSVPLLVHYLAAHLLSTSDTIVSKNILGAEIVSVVSIALSVNHILTILLQSVSGAVSTWLMDNLEQKNTGAVRKGTLLYTAGVMVLASGVMLLAPEVIWILGGPKYADAVPLLPGMVVASMIQSITTIFTIILTYDKRVVKTALYTTVVSVLCVGGKVFLLPIMGVKILPFVNIVCFGILAVINYTLIAKAGYGKYINLKGILAIIAASFVVMAGSYFLYGHTIIRYSIIAILAVCAMAVMYRYRSYIIKFINKKLKRNK